MLFVGLGIGVVVGVAAGVGLVFYAIKAGTDA